jgi:hypothetical protein
MKGMGLVFDQRPVRSCRADVRDRGPMRARAAVVEDLA